MASQPAAPNPQFFFSIVLQMLLLFTPLQITQARDSQFFSKVTRPDTNNPINVEDVPGRTNLDQPNEEYVDDQLGFIPQTTNSGYGLYSHETASTDETNDNDPQYYYTVFSNVPENGERRYSSHGNGKNMHAHVDRHVTREGQDHSGSSTTGFGCKSRGKNYAHELSGPGVGSGHVHDEERNIHDFHNNEDLQRRRHRQSEQVRFAEDRKYTSDDVNAENPRTEMSKMAGRDEYFSSYNSNIAAKENKYYFNNYGDDDDSGKGMSRGGNQQFNNYNNYQYHHEDFGRNENNGERGTESKNNMGNYNQYDTNYYNRDDGESALSSNNGKYEYFDSDVMDNDTNYK